MDIRIDKLEYLVIFVEFINSYSLDYYIESLDKESFSNLIYITNRENFIRYSDRCDYVLNRLENVEKEWCFVIFHCDNIGTAINRTISFIKNCNTQDDVDISDLKIQEIINGEICIFSFY